MWSKEELHELIQTQFRDYQLIVVANREPYIHRHVGNGIECFSPASGMATALDPIMRASGGIWVAHGGGDADRETVDSHDHVQVPPDDPCYTLRRVWLTKAQEEGYYYGLANGGLWPLCHITFTRPTFNPHDWDTYRQVNQLFADAVLEEVRDTTDNRVRAGLPLCTAASIVEGCESRSHRGAVLAHSVAEPRDVSNVSVERRTAARNVGKRSARVSPARSLPEFSRYG